jgi:hypothetical protein
MRVVLPAPLGPRSPKILFFGTFMETSDNALNFPKLLETLLTSKMLFI